MLHASLQEQLTKAGADTTLPPFTQLCDLVSDTYYRHEHEVDELKTLLKDKVAELSAIIHSLPQGLLTLDEFGYICKSNNAAESIVKTPASHIIGSNIRQLWPDFDFNSLCYNGILDDDLIRNFFKHPVCATMRLGDHTYLETHLSFSPIRSKQTHLFSCLFFPKTEAADLQNQDSTCLAKSCDPLTGVASRYTFLSYLEELLTQSGDTSICALLFINIDKFNSINEKLGFKIGDALLLDVCDKIKKLLRPSDMLARVESDGFVALLTDIKDFSYASKVSQRLLDAFKDATHVLDKHVSVTLSIGICPLVNDRGYTSDDILQNARSAMRESKKSGGNSLTLFQDINRNSSKETEELERELSLAIERDEIILYYQPIVDLATGKLAGFEGLARWIHPQRGFIPPDKFIGLAEDTGLILPLGLSVMKRACQQTLTWRKTYPFDIFVSVNLSAKQILDKEACDEIIETLVAAKLPPHSLKIEFTETVVLKELDHIAHFFHTVNELEIDLCIDDFGTGYSALDYIHRFNFDVLKIDKKFITAITDNDKDLWLVGGIVSLVHSLGLKVVAEGVEIQEEILRLIPMDVDYIQGYFFSKPMKHEDATALLQNGASFPTTYLTQKPDEPCFDFIRNF